MNPNSSIKISNLSKQYRLGLVGTGTLAHDLRRWWEMNVLRREDPNLLVGEANVRDKYGDTPYVWALKDIDIEIEQGDVVGIIGKNGAGKSTLLKILSRVTKPTTGTIEYRGRMASLLEVGTGFHAEMTGRENIYMNGSIMGMTRHEITRKLDEIIAFAGVERYIDTPVKRYSSGMTVRLGFSVAAHLEPDILVVDEVLAVGDAEFQKKAIGKMQDVSKGGGRTVLFVSHNMGAVASLCQKGLLLKDGIISKTGNASDVIASYLNNEEAVNRKRLEQDEKRRGNGEVIFADFFLEDETGKKLDKVLTGESIFLVFVICANKDNVENIDLGFSIHDEYDDPLIVLYSSYQNIKFHLPEKGYYKIGFKYSNLNLAPGIKRIRGLINVNGELADWPDNILGNLNIEMGDFFKTGFTQINPRVALLKKGEWQISNQKNYEAIYC